MTIVLVTGGFDPLHSGHIAYFEAAKKLGDQLVVGINSDAWLVRKKEIICKVETYEPENKVTKIGRASCRERV